MTSWSLWVFIFFKKMITENGARLRLSLIIQSYIPLGMQPFRRMTKRFILFLICPEAAAVRIYGKAPKPKTDGGNLKTWVRSSIHPTMKCFPLLPNRETCISLPKDIPVSEGWMFSAAGWKMEIFALRKIWDIP